MPELQPCTGYWVNKDKVSQLYETALATRQIGLFAAHKGLWYDEFDYLVVDSIKPKLVKVVKYRKGYDGEMIEINGRPTRESLQRLIDLGLLTAMTDAEYAKLLLTTKER